jgi:hypothetical protein
VTSKHDDHDPAGHHYAHAHHEDGSGEDHAHAPPPGTRWGWRMEARIDRDHWLSGLRPCSGAILVLVFATAQGLFRVGAGSAVDDGVRNPHHRCDDCTVAVMGRDTASRLAAARSRHGALAIRGVEVAAITGFRVLRLLGERTHDWITNA